MAHTGENEQALRKIIDFTRMGSIVILVFHFYYFCHQALQLWKLTIEFADKVLVSLIKTGLFDGIYPSKAIALSLLFISLIGAKGKKDDKANLQASAVIIGLGMILFLLGHYVFR
jgi:hypothetical protein